MGRNVSAAGFESARLLDFPKDPDISARDLASLPWAPFSWSQTWETGDRGSGSDNGSGMTDFQSCFVMATAVRDKIDGDVR